MKLNLTKNRGRILRYTCVFVLIGFGAGIGIFFNWWWNVYLPQQAYVPNKPVNQFEDTSMESAYYPRPARTTSIYSINMSNLPGDTAVTMLTMAGVIAKGPAGPKIYVENDGGYYSDWLDLIRAENITVIPATDPWALVAQSAGNMTGYIVYKSDSAGVQQSNDPILSADTLSYQHQDESYCVAVSLSGLMNACVVEESNVTAAQAAGLSQVFDARGKDVEWLFASTYFGQLRHDMIFEVEHHTSRRLHLIDYPVFCNAPVWHAQTHDQRAEFLKNFEADSPSFGWGAVGPTDEAGLNLQVTAAGGFFMPSDWCRDITVFASINVTCEQQALPAPVVEENVHYVSILMSDGDNLQWAMGDYGDPRWFGNEHRGEFAMGWMLPPAMADLAPLIMRHYYQEASPLDRFVAGNSGHGLIYNSKHPWHELHVNRSAAILERADLDVVVIQDFGWQKATFEPTLNIPGVKGVIYNDYTQYALQSGKSLWVNDKPAISFTYNFWALFDTADEISLFVNTGSTAVHTPNAYTLIVVHAWSYNMNDVYNLVQRFGNNVRVVDPDTFLTLYTMNVAHMDSEVFNIWHFISLYGPYIALAGGIAMVFITWNYLYQRRKKRAVAAMAKASDALAPDKAPDKAPDNK
ncbi:MAG: hypothetical protein GYA24_08700 [Candidatus Lokiarchaeota archaeon]|nr:hypothetical protein [Candidatus Lokiarchaeota archaeon]